MLFLHQCAQRELVQKQESALILKACAFHQQKVNGLDRGDKDRAQLRQP